MGFNKRGRERHEELVEYILEELGEFMAPDWLGRAVTMNDLWHLNKTLIVRRGQNSNSSLFWHFITVLCYTQNFANIFQIHANIF